MGPKAARKLCIGQYELVRLVGAGEVAEVYEARRVGLHGFSRRVAVKRILPQHRADARLVERLVTEARVAASLNHPNLVGVLDFGDEGGELYLAMEFVDGLSCRELMSAVAARGQRVALGPALHIAREVLRALDYLHTARDEGGAPRRLVHRGVFPGNVLLGKAGVVKVTDFGVVRGDALPTSTGSGEIRGKIGYISPEQARGAEVDARSDLFSVGVLLAELLIGCRLFPGTSELEVLAHLHRGNLTRLVERGRDLPLDLLTVLQVVLAPRPAERPGSARVVAAELEAIAATHHLELTDHALTEYMAGLGLIALTSEIRDVRSVRPPHSLVPLPAVPLEVSWSDVPPRTSTLPPARPPLSTRPDAPAALRASPPEALVSGAPEPRRATYRIAEPDGPAVALAPLLGLVATGAVTYGTLVSRAGGPFHAAGTFAELRLAARAPYRFGEPLELRASEHLAIVPGLFPRWLFRLATSRRTGLLCAKHGGEQVRVYCVDGVPAFTATSDRSSLIGELLVRDGRVPRAAVDPALEAAWERGLRLGDYLVQTGAVHPNVVLAAAITQRRERLQALMRWNQGTAFFVDQLTSGEADPCPTAAPLPLVTEAVLRAFSLEELSWFLADVRRAPLQRTPHAERVTLSLGLPLAQARALARAHHATDLGALVQTLSRERVAEPLEVLQGVYVGLCVGALTSSGWR